MTPKLYELWPGRLWTRGRTNHLDRRDHEAILDTGPRLVVQVCNRPDPAWLNIPIDRVVFWNRPMADGPKIPDWIEGLADQIAETGQPTLIYCNAGRNRSTFLAGLVLTRIAGMTGQQAIDHIRQHRPTALANPLFEAYLRAVNCPDIGPCIAAELGGRGC